MVGAIVCNAATRYVRKSVGSFSPASSDSQATCRSHPATHALTSVVFPKPAGAAMRVSLRCRPSFSRSIRRGRMTTFGRSGGIYSFVARIGVGMPAYFPSSAACLFLLFLHESPECLLPCSYSTHLFTQHCLQLSNVGECWVSPALFP